MGKDSNTEDHTGNDTPNPQSFPPWGVVNPIEQQNLGLIQAENLIKSLMKRMTSSRQIN